MKRTWFASAVALALVFTPVAGRAQTGFSLGGQLTGGSFSGGTGPRGGVGVRAVAEYGLTRRLGVYLAGEHSGTVATTERYGDLDSSTTQGDVGLRYRLGRSSASFQPYVSLAASAVSLHESINNIDAPDTRYTTYGLAATLGVGVRHALSRSTSLDLGLQQTMGAQSRIKQFGEDRDLWGDRSFRATRLQVGITWRP